MKQTRRKCKTRESRETRIMIGLRFKYQLADAGLSIAEAAKLLHVTERTVRYWISGKVSVPYAAYKLVRVLRYFELPGDQWKGWHFAAGKLWSPEGHGFEAHDATWWSLLVRQAKSFRSLYQRQAAFDQVLKGLGDERTGGTLGRSRVTPAGPGAPAGCEAPRNDGTAGRREAPGLYLSLEHFGTSRLKKPSSPRENDVPRMLLAPTNLIGGESWL